MSDVYHFPIPISFPENVFILFSYIQRERERECIIIRFKMSLKLFTACIRCESKGLFYIFLHSLEVLVTLTSDSGKLLSKLHHVQPKGKVKLLTGIRIAHVSYVIYIIYDTVIFAKVDLFPQSITNFLI